MRRRTRMSFEHLQAVSPLTTYRPLVQHYGSWLNGYTWTLYCSGSFRTKPRDEHEAAVRLDRFVLAFTRAMAFQRRQITYFAVHETGKWSGLGGVRPHWHFLLSCPKHPLVQRVAHQLWFAGQGFGKFEAFDASKPGTHYICKLLADGATPWEFNMKRLLYHGPTDLLAASNESRFVPLRLPDRVFGEFLVTRRERDTADLPERINSLAKSEAAQ